MKLLQNFLKRISNLQKWFSKQSIFKKILAIGIIIFIVWFIFSKSVSRTSAPEYQTAQVEKGTIVSSITASGNISSGNSVNITTAATGVVSQVYVKNGETVIAGQKIADVILDQNAQQRQASAYASYLSAQNNLITSQNKMYSLQSALFKANQAFVNDKGITNPSTDQKNDPKYIEENADWLQAEADYKNQSNIIAQAQSSFSSASISLAQNSSTITAPVGGTITNLTVSQGSPISQSSQSSSNSNSIATQSLGSIHIEGGALQSTVNLSEIDVTKIEVGQKVTITLSAFPDKTFTGKISAIDTSGNISSGVTNYPAVITLDQTDAKIYPNMAVDAKIITDIKNSVLIVPTLAVQTQNNQTSVGVLKNGKVSYINVETGISSDTQIEILSGLSEGDIVVTNTITPVSTTTQSGTSPFGGNAGFGVFRAGGTGGGTGNRGVTNVAR